MFKWIRFDAGSDDGSDRCASFIHNAKCIIEILEVWGKLGEINYAVFSKLQKILIKETCLASIL